MATIRVDFITMIPPELLGVIFVHCSHLDADAPLVLSAVSQTFQRVVQATPRVWQRLELSTSEGNDGACERKSELWFSMSKACSLGVFVEIEPTKEAPALRTTGFPHVGTSDLKKVEPQQTSLLLALLRREILRINSLQLRATTEAQARSFLALLYDCLDIPPPLRQLTLDITTESPVRNRSQPPSPASLPPLPHLMHLAISSHVLCCISHTNLHNLRSLIISGPLRSCPVSFHTLTDILHSTLSLECLDLEARITTDIPPSSHLSIAAAPATASDDVESHSELITLPYLKHLSLRTNNLPAILERLLLPNLNSLNLHDLDGKRPASAEETGAVLRQLLVRMDLPNEHRQGDACLRVLKLIGVGISPKRGLLLGRTEDVWEWCFRRMRSLRDMVIENVDSSAHLLKILAAPVHVSSGTSELSCPDLQHLHIVDSISPSTIDRFRLRRPNVVVDVDIRADPFANDPNDPFNLHPTPKASLSYS